MNNKNHISPYCYPSAEETEALREKSKNALPSHEEMKKAWELICIAEDAKRQLSLLSLQPGFFSGVNWAVEHLESFKAVKERLSLPDIITKAQWAVYERKKLLQAEYGSEGVKKFQQGADAIIEEIRGLLK